MGCSAPPPPPPPPPSQPPKQCNTITTTTTWYKCDTCDGSVLHLVGKCPYYICERCDVIGHNRDACPRNLWKPASPASTAYEIPMPVVVKHKHQHSPLWAQLPMSPRLVSELYAIPASTDMQCQEGRPIAFRILHEGVLRPMEITLKAHIKDHKMTAIEITNHYPNSRSKKSTSMTVPVEGCLPLFNILHSIENQAIHPWMEDLFYPASYSAIRNTYTWPYGEGKWHMAHLSFAICTDTINGYPEETDRTVEINFLHGTDTNFRPGNTCNIPWILVTPIRMRIETLISEWRLYTTKEADLMRRVQKVQYGPKESKC